MGYNKRGLTLLNRFHATRETPAINSEDNFRLSLNRFCAREEFTCLMHFLICFSSSEFDAISSCWYSLTKIPTVFAGEIYKFRTFLYQQHTFFDGLFRLLVLGIASALHRLNSCFLSALILFAMCVRFSSFSAERSRLKVEIFASITSSHLAKGINNRVKLWICSSFNDRNIAIDWDSCGHSLSC